MVEKYRIVYYPSVFTKKKDNDNYFTWESQINALHDAGYEIHTVRDEFIVMKLNEASKYEDVDSVKQVSHDEVSKWVNSDGGWTVDSIYSKHTILVRRPK